ncbi:TIGR03086 family metal-binding protein [Plantactinospora sp. B5E13]|uniref:TIGR03086 family metal-binding protein n=1 Tax=unclassified Plantactinospora TaxID=2631981 RepID=UPI00325D0DBF
MELLPAYRRTLSHLADQVGQVGYDQWAAPTPCPDWDVRALVNHVVGELYWSVPLLAGARVAEVGDRFSGDLLGTDPAAVARDAAAQADRAAGEPGVWDRTVRLSSGPTSADEYLHELMAECLVHGWDLSVAVGSVVRLDPEAVRECARWFTGRSAGYRSSGLTASEVELPPGADDQARFIAAFGRDPGWRVEA